MKTNKMKLTLASTFILGALANPLTTIAGDRGGNGGSGGDAEIAAQQAQFEGVASKIKNFFSQNEKELASQFKEVNIPKLIEKIDASSILVNNEELTDRHGKKRTCLNFAEENLIHCNASALKVLNTSPEALFVLAFHEYLGLLGVEETSPNDPTVVDGYSISKRIATYVTLINDYDLRLNRNNKCRVSTNSENTYLFLLNEGFQRSHYISAQAELTVIYKRKKPIRVEVGIRESSSSMVRFSSHEITNDLSLALMVAKNDLNLACSKAFQVRDVKVMNPSVNGFPLLAVKASEKRTSYALLYHVPEWRKSRAKDICLNWGFDDSNDHTTVSIDALSRVALTNNESPTIFKAKNDRMDSGVKVSTSVFESISCYNY